MKRWIVTLALAAVVFAAVLAFLSGLEKKATVVVAARDVPAGAVLTSEDVEEKTMHASGVAEGAYSSVSDVLGRRIGLPRARGDQITEAVFRAEPSQAKLLRADERAVALRLTDAQGVMGNLKPGDHVSAIIYDREQARLELTGLRVLDVSWDFKYTAPEQRTTTTVLGGGTTTAQVEAPRVTSRRTEGVVVLAVPNVVLTNTLVTHTDDGNVVTTTARIYAPVALVLANSGQPKGVWLVLEPERPQTVEETTTVQWPWLFPTPAPDPTPTAPDGLTVTLSLTATSTVSASTSISPTERSE